MKTSWAAFFLLLAPLACVAQQALPAWTPDNEKAWWTQNPTPASWTKAAADLRAQLDASYKKDGSAVFSQSDFQGWLDHLEWIQLGLAAPDLLAKPENLQTFIALGNDEKLSHQLVEKMVPQDKPTAALGLLIRLAQANMADLHEYAALGIAYCLVFDSLFPEDWPHYQVARSAVPIGDSDVVARFNFYVEANRGQKTDLDLTQQTFENLKYLVDSEVSLSELQYAQGKRYSYSHFADAYFAIHYVMARITFGKEVYHWPFPTYRLQDIETNGGICIDQSYYASMVGKGRGIPTMMFSGEGTDSAHAWFGYLDRSGKWEMDCGRYESGGYVKGVTRDPQTWEKITDTAIEQFIKNGVSNPNYQTAKIALAWARLHGNDAVAKSAFDDARTLMPELVETWEAESAYLDRSYASPDDQKAFYQAWISQFSSSPDLKVEGQKHLLAVLQKANDPDAGSLQQDIVLQNRRDGVDLGVQGSQQNILDKLKAHDWDGGRMEFEKAIRDFAEQGGLTFFEHVVWPYAQACMYYGQLDQADEGLHFAEERINIDPRSQLGEAFQKLKDQLAEEKEAKAAVENWLGELDDGKADEAFSEATPAIQSPGLSSEKWAAGIAAARQSGSSASRTLTGLSFAHHGPPPGGDAIRADFIEAQYATVFDSKPKMTETVFFEKTGDRKWQAYSYDCR